MNADEHLRQAEQNEELAEFLSIAPYPDWRCTALFYAALHYVEAYFASRTPRLRYSSHGERAEAVRLDDQIGVLYKPFDSLRDSSRYARYEGWKPSETQIQTEIITKLFIIKRHLRRFLPKIKA